MKFTKKYTLDLIMVAVLTIAGSSIANAYKTESDCESHEGGGACSECGGGWHRHNACTIIVQNPLSDKASKADKTSKEINAAKEVNAAEAVKRLEKSVAK